MMKLSFASIKSLLKIGKKPIKKIAFIDGDQPIPTLIHAYENHLKGTNSEILFVRQSSTGLAPKAVRSKMQGVNVILLSGYSTGKEVVDKFIAGYIQLAVCEGYEEITVVSSDYDFIDIFKMAVKINPIAGTIKFRLVIPQANGKTLDLPDQLLNIEIIKQHD